MNQQSGLSAFATELSDDPDDLESPEDPPQPASDNASVAVIIAANTLLFFILFPPFSVFYIRIDSELLVWDRL